MSPARPAGEGAAELFDREGASEAAPGEGQQPRTQWQLDRIKQRIIVAYEEKCPTKVSLVEGVMTTYAGADREYYLKVCKFYGWPDRPTSCK